MTKSVVEETNTGVTPWTSFASWAVERIGVALVGKPRHGALTVIFPNGRTRTVGSPSTSKSDRSTSLLAFESMSMAVTSPSDV